MKNPAHFFALVAIAVIFFGVLLGATGMVSFSSMRGNLGLSSSYPVSSSSSSMSLVSSSVMTSMSSSSEDMSSSVGFSSSDTLAKKGDLCTKNLQCKPLACINGSCQ